MNRDVLSLFAHLPLKERRFVRGRLASAPLHELAARAAGETLLDVGCGHGALVALLAAEHPERRVVGIDPDERGSRDTRDGGVIGRVLPVEREGGDGPTDDDWMGAQS